MTKPDTQATEESFSHKKYWVQLIGWSVLLSLALIGGLLVGVASINLFEGEWDQSDIWFAAIGAPLTLIAFYFLWKWFPDFTMGEPYTSRGKRARWLQAAGIAVGLLITGTFIYAGSDGGSNLLWSNEAMPFGAGLIIILAWGILLPLIIVFARRNTDEHRLAAQDFATMITGHFFLYAAPIWWMGWRTGIFPQPDIMILFIAGLWVGWLATIWKQVS